MPKRVNPRCPLGKELGKMRIDLDESTNDMGKRLAVHPSTLRSYESGHRLPDQTFFKQIKAVYGVDLSRFYVEPTRSATSVLGRFMALPESELVEIDGIFRRNSIPTPKIVLKAIAEKRGEKLPEKAGEAPKPALKTKPKPLGKPALKPKATPVEEQITIIDIDDDLSELDDL